MKGAANIGIVRMCLTRQRPRLRYILFHGIRHLSAGSARSALLSLWLKCGAALLRHGVSILDTTYELGYLDQPHLTRSLKPWIGHTPAQIANVETGG
jgi:hypothetical protein